MDESRVIDRCLRGRVDTLWSELLHMREIWVEHPRYFSFMPNTIPGNILDTPFSAFVSNSKHSSRTEFRRVGRAFEGKLVVFMCYLTELP
jgi:hypothetical protein